MFKKAIVATDLSESSNSIIGCLEGLKSYGAEEVLLLRSVGMRQATSIGLSYDSDGIESTLQNEKRLLENQGYRVETRTVVGTPKHEINKLAVEEDYSLIVVGAKEETLLRQAFFGELAYDVINHSEKPVLLIRLGESSKSGIGNIRPIRPGLSNHILFPTDFSENSEIAFEFVKDLVKNGVGKVTMIHVQDESIVKSDSEDHIEDFNKIDRERLETMKKILMETDGVEVDTIVEFGSPSLKTLNLVDKLGIDLVVMGTHGRGFVKELFLGSVSNHIARHAKIPVLLIPAKSERKNK